jgi:hypothetical protein
LATPPPISYLDLPLRFERMGPTFRHYWKSQFVGRADDGLVDAIVGAHASQPRSTSLILIEPMHGQVHRIPEDSAAFGARAAVANVSALAIWDDPADDNPEIAWARDSAPAWAPWSLRGGGYVNYSAFYEALAVWSRPRLGAVLAAPGREASLRSDNRSLQRQYPPA